MAQKLPFRYTTINFLITSILQNIFLYIQYKKETRTGLERSEAE